MVAPLVAGTDSYRSPGCQLVKVDEQQSVVVLERESQGEVRTDKTGRS